MSVKAFINNVNPNTLPPPLLNAFSIAAKNNSHVDHGNHADGHSDQPRDPYSDYADHTNHSDSSSKKDSGSKKS